MCDSDGDRKYPQVPDNTRSPEVDGMSPHCPADGVIQAVSQSAGVRQTSGALDSETTVHRVLRHIQLSRSQWHQSSSCCHAICRGLFLFFIDLCMFSFCFYMCAWLRVPCLSLALVSAVALTLKATFLAVISGLVVEQSAVINAVVGDCMGM